jgi:hypothetical protein
MTDLVTPDTLATAAAIPVVKKALDSLAATLHRGAGAIAKRVLDRTIANLQIGFAPYLQTSYGRCRLVKTLLSQDRPLSLLDVYVNLSLDCKNQHLTDDDLIQDLDSYRRVVITGLAGSGKSMFMKYLTICRFENPQGAIPLFVELRELNSQPSKKLLTYIHKSCASADASVTYDQFDLALRAGGLLLILDGFDEIDFAHRDQIARQVLDISIKYPKVDIIISSRPDEQFSSWQDFYIFMVRALTRPQVIRLINKIDYDRDLKRHFIEQIHYHLYDSHKSFLSSPLLATIMLLTYEYFAEIPNKMHIFYEQAFAALFRRHDAQKAQFTRKTYANLAIDDFRNCFAAFCAFSYLEEQFEFLDGDLRKLMVVALNYARVTAKVENVIRDLYEAVCLFQRDGVNTVFVHRSFQEYFCALFMANYHGPQMRAMLDKLAQRTEDEVMPMLFEMARDKVDREWVLPQIEEITSGFGNVIDDRARTIMSSRLVHTYSFSLYWRNVDKFRVGGSYFTVGSAFRPCLLIIKLYRNKKSLNLHFVDFESIIDRAIQEHGITRNSTVEEVKEAIGFLGDVHKPKEVGTSRMSKLDADAVLVITMSPEMLELGFKQRAGELIEDLRLIKKSIEDRVGGQDSIVELLCGEGIPARKGRARPRKGPSALTSP